MNIANNHSLFNFQAGIGQRHIQIILLFAGLFFSYALRTNLSVGIVAMVAKNSTVTVSKTF